MLGHVADRVLDAPAADREAARRVVLQLGAPGAQSLCSARERGSIHGQGWAGRARYVAAMRDLGATPAGAAVALRTLEAFLLQSDPRDAALLEDHLRSIPDAADERLGANLTSRELRHEAPAVRRAAVAALSSTWGPRANPWFSALVEDADDTVRIAALAALRRHGGLDLEAVRRVGRLLTAAVPAGAEAKTAAAAALAEATGPEAKTAAAAALVHALGTSSSSSGFFQRMVTADDHRDDGVLLTMAKALLAIGGPEGAKIVQTRASRAGGELKRQLLGLLEAGGVGRR